MQKVLGFSTTSMTMSRLFLSCGFYLSAAYVQLEFGESATSIRVRLLFRREGTGTSSLGSVSLFVCFQKEFLEVISGELGAERLHLAKHFYLRILGVTVIKVSSTSKEQTKQRSESVEEVENNQVCYWWAGGHRAEYQLYNW